MVRSAECIALRRLYGLQSKFCEEILVVLERTMVVVENDILVGNLFDALGEFEGVIVPETFGHEA